MQRELTPARSFMASSHSREPHHLDRRKPPFPSAMALASSGEAMSKVLSSRFWSACAYMLSWTSSRSFFTVSSSSARGTVTFSPVSRRATTHCSFSMSLGPISTRRGTPFISYSANFQPGELSESSILERMPAVFSRSRRAAAASSTPGLWAATGMTTAWMGATRGGSTRPLSSPWVMMMPPIIRVETPQLVWWGWWSWLSFPV